MSHTLRRNLVALTAIVLAVSILFSLGGTAASSAPETQSTTPTPGAAARSQGSGDAWSRVRSSGKLVVGTAGDYPPFTFYDKNFKLDGFDVALMKAIAQRLGLQVQFKDFAFDGLLNALQLGQVDAAIAAISVIPERERLVDFTDVYYVSSDAVLSRTGSKLTGVDEIEDLARYRVGVQGDSVYEKWLTADLIDTGLMLERNLLTYADVDKAVSDLKRGRLDAVVMDLEPAKAYELEGGVKVVGDGLNRQLFAIAVPSGQGQVQANLNAALEDLQDRGVVADLVETYIGLEGSETAPLPTPTPVPCIDGMAWVADLTYDDSRGVPPVQPGQRFRKGWRIRNSGTCAWTGAYQLSYAGGNVPDAQMQGRPIPIITTVPPGATVDLYVDLVAPYAPGVYQGFWQMRNDKNQAFGERIWVKVQVPPPPTPTPVPPPPNANISFTVDRTNIRAGECVRFSWDVRNASEVYFYREGENWQDNPAVGQESRDVCPPYTSAHYLRVVNRDGTVDMRPITIYVDSPGGPQITRFDLVPQGNITQGNCVALAWEVQGSADRVALKRLNNVLWDYAPLRGNMDDCPPAGNMVYVLEASQGGNTVQAQRSVTVFSPAQPTPVPPPSGTRPLGGTSWAVIGVNNAATLPGTVTIAGFGSDGRVRGNTGCNDYEGPYSISGDQITISAIYNLTNQYCQGQEALMAQEANYFAALQAARRFTINGSMLLMYNDRGQEVLRMVLK